MRTLIIPILCCLLFTACINSNKKQNQSAQEPEIAAQEPAETEPAIVGTEDLGIWEKASIDTTTFTETLQFMGSGEGEEGFREFFLTRNFEILEMYPMEDAFEDKDANKLFIVNWQEGKYPDGRKELYLSNREEIPGAEPYVTRRIYSQDDGYTNIIEEGYKGKTLKEVYGIIVRNETVFNYHLREKLPSRNTDYKSDKRDEEVEVAYRFKTSKHLTIELNYPGGITTVEIVESSEKTVSKITYSAD